MERYFEKSVVVDLLDLRLNRELLGESIEKQRQRVFETIANGGKDKSRVEERIEELDTQIHKAILRLNIYRRKTSS